MSIHFNKLYCVVAALAVWLGSFAPVAAQATLDEMLDALSQSEPAEAARLTREIERLWELSGSTTVDMLFRRGREAMEAEDIDAAIEHLTAVTDHAPDFAEGWHARATAYYMKDLYGPALSDLQQALTLNPQNYNALFGLGLMLREFGDLARAELAFRDVLALHPHHENATKALEQLRRDGVGREL
ncbi:MAG: tetratricopeptide repeat protein [Pseudomonadota bacterium]